MAADAVAIKPVSRVQFPISGKIYGNLSETAAVSRNPRRVLQQNQSLAPQFPVHPIWEFCARIWENMALLPLKIGILDRKCHY